MANNAEGGDFVEDWWTTIEAARLAGPRWVEIDSDAIFHNVGAVKERIAPGVKLMAVVKADAYGCGAVETARVAAAAGADFFGVTTLEEGLELRNGGIDRPILVFAPLVGGASLAASNRLAVTLAGMDRIEELENGAKAIGKTLDVHIKVETGLGRTGLFPGDVVRAAEALRDAPHLNLEGIFTHFATAGRDGRFVEHQFQVFLRVLDALQAAGIRIPLRHVCNSAATFEHPAMHLDMVRVGTLLYGQYPGGKKRNWGLDLRDPFRVRVRLLHVWNAPAGSAIGYGRDYVCPRDTRVGVIPVGIADGFGVQPVSRPKSLPDLIKTIGKAVLAYLGWEPASPLSVKCQGSSLPVIGRVGMQLTMVDLNNRPEAQPGDVVEIKLRRLTTSARLPRVYTREGKPYQVRGLQGEVPWHRLLILRRLTNAHGISATRRFQVKNKKGFRQSNS
ncbi:MAG: alanine racemase [Bacillota bacterium]